MKFKGFSGPLLFFIFGGLLIILLVAFGFLYQQNMAIKRENRILIIQNDSIMSANIELKNSLKQMAGVPGRKSLAKGGKH